jgi:putative transcriptional regulator
MLDLTGQELHSVRMLKNSVEQFRRRRGVSKSHLARQIEVCPSYITRLENMDIQPSGQVMFRIAAYFKCRIEDIFHPEAVNGKG